MHAQLKDQLKYASAIFFSGYKNPIPNSLHIFSHASVPPCLCICVCVHMWTLVSVHGHLCVCVTSIPPSCHPAFLFCCAYFSISPISAQIATNPCAHPGTHTSISPNHYLTEWNTSTIRHTLSQRHICDWDSGKWKENPCYITWVSQSRPVLGHRGSVVVCVLLCECMILCGPACMCYCVDIPQREGKQKECVSLCVREKDGSSKREEGREI